MKKNNYLADAINSEPLFKYSIFLIKWTIIIIYSLTYFSIILIFELIIGFTENHNTSKSKHRNYEKELQDRVSNVQGQVLWEQSQR